MTDAAAPTCAECGARLAAGADTCDLCGTPIGATPDTTPPDAPDAAEPADGIEPAAESAEPAVEVPRPEASPLGGVFCHQCGWKSPPAARFCSRCGTRLQTLSAAATPAPPTPRPAPAAALPTPAAAPAAPPPRADTSGVSRQVGIIVGASLLLVVALFLVTVVSKSRPASTPPPQTAPASNTLPPLDASVAAEAGALEAEIEALDGEARAEKQRELVSLFFNAGRLDRAALEQQSIAEATQAPTDWRRAGDLLYDWMVTLDGSQKVSVAQQAVAAYQRVLETDPDNLDVRTDMATAYLNSNNPMKGVEEVKRVLETDSTHIQARFNYGVMLSLIGRVDQAVEQFERVKTLVTPDTRYYQQADEAIRAIRQDGSS